MKFFSNFTKLKKFLSKFCETQNFDKIIFIFEKFEENFAKHEIKNFLKISRNYKNEVLQQPYAGVKWRGEAGQYSPGASSALTQIVPYSASLYTVFHSVIYNYVCSIQFTVYNVGIILKNALILVSSAVLEKRT